MSGANNNDGKGQGGGNLQDEAEKPLSESGGRRRPRLFGAPDARTEDSSASQRASEMGQAMLRIPVRNDEISEILKLQPGEDAETYQNRLIELARAERDAAIACRSDNKLLDMEVHRVALKRIIDALNGEGLEGDERVAGLMLPATDDDASYLFDEEALRALADKKGVRDVGSEIAAELDAEGIEPIAPERAPAAAEAAVHSATEDELLEAEQRLAAAYTGARPPPIPAGQDNEAVFETVNTGTFMLTPLDDAEAGRIAGLENLSAKELREMAAARKAQVNAFTGKGRMPPVSIAPWIQTAFRAISKSEMDYDEQQRAIKDVLADLMGQANALDALAAEKETLATGESQRPQAPLMPVRPTKPPRRSSAPAAAASGDDSWAVPAAGGSKARDYEERFTEDGDSGMFQLKGIGADGRVNLGYLHAKPGEAYVMGTSRGPSKRKERTEIGMPAAGAGTNDAAGEEHPFADLGRTQGIGSGQMGKGGLDEGFGVLGFPGKRLAPKTDLTRTGLFGDFDKDADIAGAVAEASERLDIHQLEGLSGAKPISDPVSQRIPTGQLPAAGNLASLEGTGIGMPAVVAASPNLGETIVIPEDGALADTRLSTAGGELGETKNERGKEDFSAYGDIFYAIEKISLESENQVNESNTKESLSDALVIATVRAGMLDERAKKAGAPKENPDSLRLVRLQRFEEDFFVVPRGAGKPKRDLDAYLEWRKAKEQEYAKISDVFDILNKELARGAGEESAVGVSPGEYDSVGLMRLCDAVINRRETSLDDKEKVIALREMIEPSFVKGDNDVYAPAYAAEYAHEMVVGFATKHERVEMRKLRKELAEYKVTVKDFQEKRGQMLEIFKEILASAGRAEANQRELRSHIKEMLMVLEPDAIKRRGLLKIITDAQSGVGPLAQAAGAASVPARRATAAPEESVSVTSERLRQALGTGTPEARMRFPEKAKLVSRARERTIGALILAAGIGIGSLLNGHELPSSWVRNVKAVAVQAENAVVNFAEQIQKSAMELPDEFVAGVDAGTAVWEMDAAAEGIGAGAEEKDAASKDAGTDAGVRVIQKVRGAQQTQKVYPRTKDGLKSALDDWCQNERGLIVSGKLLRAAYASIENSLDGSALPGDANWVGTILKAKFPNRVADLAAMSDIVRARKLTPITAAESYAAWLKVSIILGHRAGTPMTFQTTIDRAAKEGTPLVEMDNDSVVGQVDRGRIKKVTTRKDGSEIAKVRRVGKKGTSCGFAALQQRAREGMAAKHQEALDSGMNDGEFYAAVNEALGPNAERLRKMEQGSNFEATQEAKTGDCKARTRGKTGTPGLTEMGIVVGAWDAQPVKKAEHNKPDAVTEDLLAHAGKGGTATANIPPAPKRDVHAKPAAKSKCAGMEGAAAFNCLADSALGSMTIPAVNPVAVAPIEAPAPVPPKKAETPVATPKPEPVPAPKQKAVEIATPVAPHAAAEKAAPAKPLKDTDVFSQCRKQTDRCKDNGVSFTKCVSELRVGGTWGKKCVPKQTPVKAGSGSGASRAFQMPVRY